MVKLSKLFKGKIRNKLMISFLLIGLIPILVIGLVGINLIEKELKNEISNGLLRLAEAKEGQIFAYLDSIESRTIDFSSDGFIRDSLSDISKKNKEAAMYLNQHLIENKKSLDETIVGINIINLNGTVVASTDFEEIGRNVAKNKHFKIGKKQVTITNLEMDELHFKRRDFLVVAAPLTDKETGELLGVIANHFEQTKLSKILSGEFQIEKGALTANLGQNGNFETYMVDQNGRMFVHQSAEKSKIFIGTEIDTIPVKGCLEKSEEVSGIYKNYAGNEVIGATMCLPERRWIILVETLADNALKPLKALNLLLVLLSLIFSILVIFGTFFISQNISKPIKKLTIVARKLNKGNFKARTKITTDDEVAELGKTFNEVAESLEKMEEKRKEVDKIKTDFLSFVSHELRTPLTPIRAQLQRLLNKELPKEKKKESLNMILRNSIRLDKLINDILETSRIQSHQLKLKFKKSDLREIIKQVSNTMEPLARNLAVRIRLLFGNFTHEFAVDEDRFRQVLINLIDNAIKHGRPKNITISTEKKSGKLLISVSDDGVGIAEKDMTHLFEKFYVGKEEKFVHKGAGLGLTISRGIIKGHDGDIIVKSSVGKGSKFTIVLPIKNKRNKNYRTL
jgi:signal transduction histidine kinase